MNKEELELKNEELIKLLKEKDEILTQRLIMKQEEEIKRLNNIIEKLEQENAVLKTQVVNKDKYSYGIR